MTTDTAAAALAAAIVLVESEDMAASTMGVNALPPRAPPHVVLRRSLGGSARDSDSADAIEAAGRNTNSAARALRDVKGFNAKAFIEASDAAAADAIARAEVAKEYVGALIAACVCSMRNECNCVCNLIHIPPPPPHSLPPQRRRRVGCRPPRFFSGRRAACSRGFLAALRASVVSSDVGTCGCVCGDSGCVARELGMDRADRPSRCARGRLPTCVA